MKYFCILLALSLSVFGYSQTNENDDVKAIRSVLKAQRQAWSKNNIEKYMESYWKNDSLQFYGKNGLVYGWDNTLERYKRAYPTKEHTGKLSFKINSISKINDEAYYVLGEYHIKRDMGNATGIFMIVFKKINGKWKIIADTSC
ncbi:MAG: YybH family protein [Aestuariibaculum sp.]